MARKAAKQGAKHGAATTKTPPAAVLAPPPPFSRAPDLEPFLSTLNPEHVYITHIDTHPAYFKKRIFTIPLLLNAGIVALLAWRAYVALPTYWHMLMAALGNQTAFSVARASATWGQLAWIAVKRAAMFLVDYVLVMVVGTWPLTFFAEMPGNPCSWRWRVGFREREIYVRESRGWGAAELLGEEVERKGEENPFFKTRVLPAIEKRFVREKTGYVMVNESWDLDFDAMVRAHAAVDKGEIAEGAFEKSVWVFGGEGVGWCVWEVHRLDDGGEVEGRKKIVAFKDRLTAMGKESLFFRWIELIQYESNRPGGFTPERQQDAVQKARELFELQGVDFDKFVSDVGGFDGMPGLENAGR